MENASKGRTFNEVFAAANEGYWAIVNMDKDELADFVQAICDAYLRFSDEKDSLGAGWAIFEGIATAISEFYVQAAGCGLDWARRHELSRRETRYKVKFGLHAGYDVGAEDEIKVDPMGLVGNLKTLVYDAWDGVEPEMREEAVRALYLRYGVTWMGNINLKAVTKADIEAYIRQGVLGGVSGDCSLDLSYVWHEGRFDNHFVLKGFLCRSRGGAGYFYCNTIAGFSKESLEAVGKECDAGREKATA